MKESLDKIVSSQINDVERVNQMSEKLARMNLIFLSEDDFSGSLEHYLSIGVRKIDT